MLETCFSQTHLASQGHCHLMLSFIAAKCFVINPLMHDFFKINLTEDNVPYMGRYALVG
jgi:hypothetical protein